MHNQFYKEIASSEQGALKSSLQTGTQHACGNFLLDVRGSKAILFFGTINQIHMHEIHQFVSSKARAWPAIRVTSP